MKLEVISIQKVENRGAKRRILVEFDADSTPTNGWLQFFKDLVTPQVIITPAAYKVYTQAVSTTPAPTAPVTPPVSAPPASTTPPTVKTTTTTTTVTGEKK